MRDIKERLRKASQVEDILTCELILQAADHIENLETVLTSCAEHIHRLRSNWPNPEKAGDWIDLQNKINKILNTTTSE